MAGVILRPALPEDHEALECLVRETFMGKSIRIGFERDPDYFAGAKVQADDLCVWAAFEKSGRAVGLFSAGTRSVWLGGETRMRYLSDLRIHPDYRGKSLLARGFHALRESVFRPGEWAQTLVLEDNSSALEILTSGRAGLPIYHPAGRYVSWILPEQRLSCPGGILVRRATADDVEAMQDELDQSMKRRSFAAVNHLSDLGGPQWNGLSISDFLVAERGNDLVGTMAVWDQSSFQRLRIQGYSKVIDAMRPVWNLGANLKLPAPGEILPLVKATSIACANDDPAILRAMLKAALTSLGAKSLLIGFSADDPLCEAMKGLKGRMDHGRHFLVGWEGSPPEWTLPLSFDVARI
jgi:hypothetical protein